MAQNERHLPKLVHCYAHLQRPVVGGGDLTKLESERERLESKQIVQTLFQTI